MTLMSVLKGTALVTMLAASAAYAQEQGPAAAGPRRSMLEIGMDAGATFSLGNSSATSISIPEQEVRLGFHSSPHLSIEPAFGLQYVHVSGASLTQYEAVMGVLYHFTTDPRLNQVYVRPFVGMEGVSASGDHTTQALLGAGLGVKMPLSPRVAARFEANYEHVFADGNAEDVNAIGLRAGLSFYTR